MNDQLAPFGQLLYRGRAGWSPLPDWARFMLDTGARAANTRPVEGRLVVAISLPVRAFAAVLASASAVVTGFRDSPPASDAAQHFEYLASLPEGTAIAHHRANSVQQGRLIGVEFDRGDSVPRIKFVTSRGNLVRLLPEKLCTEIQVIEEPGTLRVHKQKLVKHPEFLSGALPGVDVASLSALPVSTASSSAFSTCSRTNCSPASSVPGRMTEVHEGTLQGIVRARDVGGTKHPYRSCVISASSDDGDAPVSAVSPRVAVFDGARAFNNWRSRVARSELARARRSGIPIRRGWRRRRQPGVCDAPWRLRCADWPRNSAGYRDSVVRGAAMTASMQDAADLYDAAGSLELLRVCVEEEAFQGFSLGVRELQSRLGEDATDSYWRPVLARLRRVRWELATVPLPFRHAAFTLPESEAFLADRLRDCDRVFPAHAAARA